MSYKKIVTIIILNFFMSTEGKVSAQCENIFTRFFTSKIVAAIFPTSKEGLWISVEHALDDGGKKELQWVKNKISEEQRKGAKSIGLELRQDYEERIQMGIKVAFFGELYRFAKENGIKIVLLEDPILYEEQSALVTAVEFTRTNTSIKMVERLLQLKRQAQSGFIPPEKSLSIHLDIQLFTRVLELMKHYQTLESLQDLYNQLQTKREVHMRKIIDKEKPDIVVIGTMHTQNIRKQHKHGKIKKYRLAFSPEAETIPILN